MKLNDVLKESRDEEAYAEQLGVGELSWAGSGDMGDAYYTEKDTIIKVTRDHTELEFAKLLIGKKLDNVVHIYDVKDNMIHMELLDDDVEDIHSTAGSYGWSDNEAEYFDTDDIEGDAPPEVIKFIRDVANGMYELSRNGIQNMDLKYNNIGMRGNDYVIYDMSNKKGEGGFW
jgi:hypothetical protein